MEKNRKDFYVKLVNAGVIKETKYPDWVNYFFKDQNRTHELWTTFKNNGIVTQDEKVFFKNYACDLQPNSQYCTTQQNPTPNPNPTPTGDFPPCAIKKGKVRKTPSGADVIVYKTTVWDKPSVQLYAKTNRFMVLTGTKKGKKGYYKCTQSGKLFLELDSEKKLDTKKDETKKQSSSFTNTNLTLDDILKGKGSVKMGMKGPVVGEIQNILIKLNQSKVSNSGKADNVFGKLTDLAVKQFQGNNMSKGEQDGIVGQRTLKRMIELRDYDGSPGGGDDSPEFLQAQLDAQKSQLPVNHGKRQLDDTGNTFVWDGYNQVWLSDSDYLNLYNYDGTKKLQENIIKNIVIKNLHSLL